MCYKITVTRKKINFLEHINFYSNPYEYLINEAKIL